MDICNVIIDICRIKFPCLWEFKAHFMFLCVFVLFLRRYNLLSNLCNIKLVYKPKRDENGKWKRLHNEELHSLYRLPNIIRVIKYRRLRWAGHVARMEEGRSASKF